METQVLIIGAGPTGLTLAIDLGLRGVRCTLVEQKPAPQFLPRMERCNARTMEIYRRMGIAERVRAAGLPAHCPMDVFIVQSLVEPPLYHLPYPSVGQYRAQIAACKPREGKFAAPTWSAAMAARAPCGASLASNCRAKRTCSKLRQALYRCDGLYERIPIGKGRHNHVADAQHSFLLVQDSARHFTLHALVERQSRDPRRARAGGSGGAAQVERNDRRRARLSLSGFAPRLPGPRSSA